MFETDDTVARQTYIDCAFKELGVARVIVTLALAGRPIPANIRDTYDEVREETERAVQEMVQ